MKYAIVWSSSFESQSATCITNKKKVQEVLLWRSLLGWKKGAILLAALKSHHLLVFSSNYDGWENIVRYPSNKHTQANNISNAIRPYLLSSWAAVVEVVFETNFWDFLSMMEVSVFPTCYFLLTCSLMHMNYVSTLLLKIWVSKGFDWDYTLPRNLNLKNIERWKTISVNSFLAIFWIAQKRKTKLPSALSPF